MEDDFPYYGGQGAVHDLRDADQPEPRLWFARSVSKAGAIALAKPVKVKQRRIGFRLPPVR
jgi:hypothetical protein